MAVCFFATLKEQGFSVQGGLLFNQEHRLQSVCLLFNSLPQESRHPVLDEIYGSKSADKLVIVLSQRLRAGEYADIKHFTPGDFIRLASGEVGSVPDAQPEALEGACSQSSKAAQEALGKAATKAMSPGDQSVLLRKLAGWPTLVITTAVESLRTDEFSSMAELNPAVAAQVNYWWRGGHQNLCSCYWWTVERMLFACFATQLFVVYFSFRR